MENFKINRDKKTFVFDDGEEIPIPKDKVRQVLQSKGAKKIEEQEYTRRKKEVSESLIPGLAAAQATSESGLLGFGKSAGNYLKSVQSAVSPEEGQEEFGLLDRVLDTFYARQAGQERALQEIKQEHPIASGVGGTASFLADIGLTGKMPAAAALPVLGAASSKTSFLEPGQKAGEVGRDVLTGFLLDRFFGGLGKVASARGARRAMGQTAATVEAANARELERAALAQENVASANLRETGRVKIANEAEAQRFAQQTTAREAEVAGLPALQQAENIAVAEETAQAGERIGKSIGKNPIAAEALGVEEFIEQGINQTAQAASKEGNFVTKFLRSVFKGDKEGNLTGQAIQNGMRALDDAIAGQTGASRQLLVDYKTNLINTLPDRLSNAYVVQKWGTKLQNKIVGNIAKELESSFAKSPAVNEFLVDKFGRNFTESFTKNIQKGIQDIFKKNASNFAENLQNGTIQGEIQQLIESNGQYQKVLKEVSNYYKRFQGGMSKEVAQRVTPGYEALEKAISQYPGKVVQNANKMIQKDLSGIFVDLNAQKNVTEKALGGLRVQPNILSEPAAVNPAIKINPNLQAAAPAPNLQSVPQMGEPQNLIQRLAAGLEGFTGKNALGAVPQGTQMGILAKLAGIPIGKAAAGIGATGLGLKALTSPTMAGQAVRGGLNQAARALSIAQNQAQKYPSHRGNGILDNPLERRSLVREIEDDHEMSLEDKAIIQSKINRGLPLH